MLFPFSKKLNDLFESDRSAKPKIAGSSLVVVMIVASAFDDELIKAWGKGILGIAEVAIVLLCAAVAGGFIGLTLCFRDYVQNQISEGKRVNPLLNLFFGTGYRRVFFWIVFFIGIIAITVLLFVL